MDSATEPSPGAYMVEVTIIQPSAILRFVMLRVTVA